MEMPKKAGIIFVTMGVVLILSALLLFLYNGLEDRRAGQEAELLLNDIQSAITDGTEPTTPPMNSETDSTETTDSTEAVETLPAEMPTLLIDGYEYIGYISIPDLDLELPVMAEWDYSRLKIAPCRHFGSSRTDDLVIAAHNYKSHFGSLSSLKEGAEVIFTDMDGIVNRYVLVHDPETLAPDAVEAVQNSDYGLVLYTCTPGGATRVVAFFDRVTEEINDESREQTENQSRRQSWPLDCVGRIHPYGQKRAQMALSLRLRNRAICFRA